MEKVFPRVEFRFLLFSMLLSLPVGGERGTDLCAGENEIYLNTLSPEAPSSIPDDLFTLSVSIYVYLYF